MCEAFAGEKNLKYIAAKPQDWVPKGYKPFAGERPERNSPSRVSFPVNSNKFALPQREGGRLLQQKSNSERLLKFFQKLRIF